MKKIAITFVLIFTLMLSGCSLFSFEDADIMSPPKATGDKAEIQQLIEDQTSSKYTLVYPKSGSNRSSIVTYDIDNDKELEAVAFYTDNNGEDVHALFFEHSDDEYSVMTEVVFDGNGIDRIEFADINNDNVNEILVGCTTTSSSQNTLHIYSYGKKITKFDQTMQYSNLVTGDFNSDNRDDILLVSLYSGDIAATARLMIYNNNGALSEIGQVELDSDITQLASIQYGALDIGCYGAVIDGVSSVGDYTTQIVIFDKSEAQLINPLFTYTGYSNTRRSTQICSLDADNDGFIDIPVCSLMPYAQNENTETVSRIIDWCKFDCENYVLNSTISTIICPNDGYALILSDKWKDTVTARYNKQKHETTVYAYEYVKNTLKTTDKLLTIKTFNSDKFDEESGFIEITSTGATTYAYSIGDTDNYLAITGDQIMSMFKLANQ